MVIRTLGTGFCEYVAGIFQLGIWCIRFHGLIWTNLSSWFMFAMIVCVYVNINMYFNDFYGQVYFRFNFGTVRCSAFCLFVLLVISWRNVLGGCISCHITLFPLVFVIKQSHLMHFSRQLTFAWCTACQSVYSLCVRVYVHVMYHCPLCACVCHRFHIHLHSWFTNWLTIDTRYQPLLKLLSYKFGGWGVNKMCYTVPYPLYMRVGTGLALNIGEVSHHTNVAVPTVGSGKKAHVRFFLSVFVFWQWCAAVWMDPNGRTRLATPGRCSQGQPKFEQSASGIASVVAFIPPGAHCPRQKIHQEALFPFCWAWESLISKAHETALL